MDNPERSPYFSHWRYDGNKLQQALQIGPKTAMYKTAEARMDDLVAGLNEQEIAHVVFTDTRGRQFDVTDASKKALLKPEWWEGFVGSLDNQDYSHLYKKSSWAYRCVQIRAQALGAIPFKIMRGDEEVDNHPVIDLLTNVNPEENWEDLIRAIDSDLMLYPNAFILKIRAGKKIRFLQRLNPALIEVIADSKGIEKFRDRSSGAIYEREDIAYFKSYDPVSDVTGVPPIQVAATAVKIEAGTNTHLLAFFENHGRPDIIFGVDTNDPNTLRKLQREWDRTHGSKTHGTRFVGGNAQAQEVGYAPDELALKDVREEARRDICAAFGVPPSMAGAWEAANYSTATEQRKFLYTEVVIPDARYLAGVFNAEIVSEYGDDLEFVFDWESLPVMQDDENTRAERYGTLVEKGIMDATAAAEELGVTPVSDAGKETLEIVNKAEHLDKWRRKAKNRIKKDSKASCDFDSDEITIAERFYISSRLENAETVDDVDDIFDAIG
jgi:HK97 family phage portal protein